MDSTAITAHITILNARAGKAAQDAPPNNAGGSPSSVGNENFSNLLNAQLNTQIPTLSDLAAAAADPVDTVAKGRSADKAEEPASDVTADNILLTNGLVAPMLAHVLPSKTNTLDTVKTDKAPLAFGEQKPDKVLKEIQEVLPTSQGAAKAAADPAKIASDDKTLPLPKIDLKINSPEPTPGVAAQWLVARQEAAAPPVINSPTATSFAIPVPLGQTGWAEAFSQRVSWVATQDQQSAHLELNPPNLGPVEVRITLNQDQASAVFVSPHSAVREAIEAALPKLREMLAENGLSMGNVNVSSQSFQQQAQQQAHQQAAQSDHGTRQQGSFLLSGENERTAPLPLPVTAVGKRGLVDIFA